MHVRQIPKASGELPRGAVNASLTRLMASATSGKPADSASLGKGEFIPSSTFKGRRPGYVFSTGSRGTGYYIDKELSHEDRQLLLDEQKKLEEADERNRRERTTAALDPEELLKQAEEAAQSKTVLDARSLKKLIGTFERKCMENLEQRVKHPNDPEKFMDSEVDLDYAVQDLFQMVNVPELYSTVIETEVLNSLLNLLSHENKDIAADVVDLLASLTDTTDNEEWIKQFQSLVSELARLDAVKLLIQHLERLTENTDEEAAVVFNILTALDNMIDALPDVAKIASENRKFVKWLLMRLSRTEFDSVKQMCGEMLVELLQHDAHSILEMNGLEVIVRAIQPIVPTEVESEDELEMVGNLFDALCCCLLVPVAQSDFIKIRGIEMTLSIIRQRKALRISGLRVLEFVTTKAPVACQRVLDASGLKTIFAFFMRKLSVSSKKDVETEQRGEEMVLAIISNLLGELEMGSGYERVAAKFVENEFEKCDRLLEAYFIYHARVVASEEEMDVTAEEDADELLKAKLDSGLATLQSICLIIARLWISGDRALRKRLLLLLHQKGHTLSNVKAVLMEMLSMMGDGEDGNQQQQFAKLISSLGGESTTEAEKGMKKDVTSISDADATRVPPFQEVPSKEELKERIATKRQHKRQRMDP